MSFNCLRFARTPVLENFCLPILFKVGSIEASGSISYPVRNNFGCNTFCSKVFVDHTSTIFIYSKVPVRWYLKFCVFHFQIGSIEASEFISYRLQNNCGSKFVRFSVFQIGKF